MDQLVSEHGTQITAIAGVIGCAVGAVLSVWSKRICSAFAVDHPDERSSPSAHGGALGLMILTGLLFAAYFHLVLNLQAQLQMHSTPEVQPDALWRYGRGIGHLVLISLLVVATATDLRDYIIPDQITLPGMAIGILLAFISGDTQIIHVWVDWNDPMTALHGPLIPTWVKEHRYWHGLAWSMAGLITGGGITWLIRWLGSLVLGQESLGFGDVTLIAMIGSFLGWQPVIFVIVLAPLCAIFAGLAVRITTGRNYIPFGPYLSLAAVIVLLSWRSLWLLEGPSEFSIRKLFGDAVGLGILAGISVVSLILLLGCVRLYRLIPGRQRDGHECER
jgi:leader peptidase (prepilin peptidase)/N-methyltransferase